MPILHWLDREKHVRAAETVPYRLLEADDTHSAGDPAAPNMLIQGDNLDALKALLPFYAGRVKCLPPDPPYNTRSAVSAHYDDNLEHSRWLSMMFPRLQIMRELLSEDGSIFVCMDDHEVHYLKVIMDEIFGRRNFVANVIWEKSDSPRMDAQNFSNRHDHILVYAKNINEFSVKKIFDSDEEIPDHFDKIDETGNPYYLKPLRAMGGMTLGLTESRCIIPFGRQMGR